MLQFYGVNNANRYIGFNNFQNDIDVVFGHVSDYWSKDNQDASSFLPRWKTQAENVGDYFLYDASYIRLRTAEIAYNFDDRSAEHTSELQSLMRISYAVFCLKKKHKQK